jgi:predicted cupin superfamily sugar epimerase
MIALSPEIIIESLGLLPHPEGGFYRESFRSEGLVPGKGKEFPAGRNFSTAIYFMLTAGNFSAFHRIRSDEIWHFYTGDPVLIIEIDKQGILKQTYLGPYIEDGQLFQHIVPAGTWFASSVAPGGSWSLTGCTVAPGFEFIDFELVERAILCQEFPFHKDVISQFTRL